MKVSLKNFIVPSIPLSVLLVLGSIVLWLSAFFGSRFATPPVQSTAFVNNIQSFIIPNSLFSNIVSISFTLLNAFLLTQINNRFTIIRTRTFLPVLVFLLLMASWNETHNANGSHLALTIITLAFFYFFSMARDRKASEQAFMGSLLISFSSILINPFLFIIPVCWIGFIMYQSFSLRTFLASVFGTAAPWLAFISAKYFISPAISLAQVFNVTPIVTFNISSISVPLIVYIACMLTILIISVFGMYSISNSDAIQTRNKLNFLLLLLIYLILLAFIFQNQFSLFLPLIALVFSLIFAHPLSLRQNTFNGILFLVFCFVNIAYIISKYILT